MAAAPINPGQAMMNTPPQQQITPAQGGLTPQEFAAKVKAKYPVYASMPDTELVQKVLAKHPEYGSQIRSPLSMEREQTAAKFERDSNAAQTSGPVKFAHRYLNNVDTMAAIPGSVMGAEGGLPGAVMGAMGGAGLAEVVKEHGEGKVSAGKVAKEAGIQGAWELGGGLLGKGVVKAAQSLGVPEAVLKFALKVGEDPERGLNPAAALNKLKLKAATTRDLYQQVSQHTQSMSNSADSIISSVENYSTMIRPYAVIRGVMDKYMSRASEVAKPEIKKAMQEILANLPDRLMTPADTNAFKRAWGDTVNWNKIFPEDELGDTYKAVQEARKDIYQALDDAIGDSLGGNAKPAWNKVNDQLFNMLQAKSALKDALAGHVSNAHNILGATADLLRKPGPASLAASAGRGMETTAGVVGHNLPNIGRAAAITQGMQQPFPMGSPTMFPQKQTSNPFFAPQQ